MTATGTSRATGGHGGGTTWGRNPVEWLRRLQAGRERSEREALARRLRRELPDFEARLSRAAEALEGATTEEIEAEAACRAADGPDALVAAAQRCELARETRRLTGIAFDVARRQVNLRAGVLRQLESELAEEE